MSILVKEDSEAGMLCVDLNSFEVYGIKQHNPSTVVQILPS